MWNIFGQQNAVDFLSGSIDKQKLSHACLIVGPKYIGKSLLALQTAQAVNCLGADPPCGQCASCNKIAQRNSPDVNMIGIKAEGKEISIDQIRDLQHTASLKPYESKRRVFIISDADRLSTEAGNALLKTLEEPPQGVLLILKAVSTSRIIATVLSRCQIIELHPVAAQLIEKELVENRHIDPDKAKMLSRICNGSIGWAIMALDDNTLIENRAAVIDNLMELGALSITSRFSYAAELAAVFARNKDEVYRVLELWIELWRDIMLIKYGCIDRIINIDRRKDLAALASACDAADVIDFIKSIQLAGVNLHRNVNPRLAMETLMLDIPHLKGTRRIKEAAVVF